jgi:hypothetical protein
LHRGSEIAINLTFYSGVGEIGGNKILLGAYNYEACKEVGKKK